MRLFLKILAGAIVLGLVLIAILLLPAHMQVRAVEPPLPSAAQLRALTAAANGPVRLRYITTSSQKMPAGRLGHTTFLVEWANGNLFMIDAGMDRAAAVEFGELMKTALSAEDVDVHGTIAELLGPDTRRVNGVGFTHLHIDHSQGTVPFCAVRGAGASVYQTSFQADQHNFNTVEGAAIVADSCLAVGTLEGETIQTLEEFPGLGVVALGGHTPGSTLFAIAVNDHLWLLSGDTTNTKEEILSDTPKSLLYSYLLVPENTARTAQLRRWLAELDRDVGTSVLVSHDLPDIEASGVPGYRR